MVEILEMDLRGIEDGLKVKSKEERVVEDDFRYVIRVIGWIVELCIETGRGFSL